MASFVYLMGLVIFVMEISEGMKEYRLVFWLLKELISVSMESNRKLKELNAALRESLSD